MRTANVQKELQQSDLLSIPRELVKSENKMLREGDLLVSTANSWNLVGKCCWVPALRYPATAGGFIAVLRGQPEKVDLRYLYHWFSSPDTQVDARNCGRQTTNISNMDIGRCLALRIPLPPLAEQRRIAAILDKADALRAKRREAIAKLDQLLQSVFLDMFGDPAGNPKGFPIAPLADAVSEARPITYGILKPGPDFDGGVPYIRVVDIQRGTVSSKTVRRTSPDIAKAYKRSTVRTGDVLMSIRGHVGRIGVVPSDLDGANITQDTARISVGPEFNPVYVRDALNSRAIQTHMQRFTRGAAVKGINLKDVREIPLPVPPTEEQERYARLAANIEALKIQSEMQAASIADLFAGLQQMAFAGTL